MSADAEDAPGLAVISDEEHRAACMRAVNLPLPIVRPNVPWLVGAMRGVRESVINGHVPPPIIANIFLDQWLACAAWSIISYLPEEPDIDVVFDLIWESIETSLHDRVERTREEFAKVFAAAMAQHQAQASDAPKN